MAARMRAAIVGFGMMGQIIARDLIGRGGSVVAVIDPAKDLPDRVEESLGKIQSTRPTLFSQFPQVSQLDIDVVIHSFATNLRDCEGVALACAQENINVATIAEDAFDPFFDDDDIVIAKRLDQAFKKAGCSFIASGVQDNYLYRIPLSLYQAHAGIARIDIANIADLAMIGPAVFSQMPIGLTEGEARKAIEEPMPGRVCFDVAIRPFVRRIGRRVVQVQNHLDLCLAEESFHVARHGISIEKGRVCGIVEKTHIVLDDGMQIDLALIARFPLPGTAAYFRYNLYGEYPSTLNVEPFHGAMATCSSVVSRALELKDAPPGFISVDQLR